MKNNCNSFVSNYYLVDFNLHFIKNCLVFLFLRMKCRNPKFLDLDFTLCSPLSPSVYAELNELCSFLNDPGHCPGLVVTEKLTYILFIPIQG